MKESAPSQKIEGQVNRAQKLEREFKKRYETLPAAKLRMFNSTETSGEVSESPFVFSPVVISINPEVVEDLTQNDKYTESELIDLKLAKRLVNLREASTIFGDFEVSSVMRVEGDTNRIDKMITEIDPNEPWQAGNIEHLLLLAKTNPELFDKPTVALGSETKQTGAVPGVQNINNQTENFSHPRAAGFSSNYCFLVVRKKG